MRARTIDIATDVVVAIFAAWTLAYHVALLAHVPRDIAAVLFVVLAIAGVVVLRRTFEEGTEGSEVPKTAGLRSFVVTGALAAVAIGGVLKGGFGSSGFAVAAIPAVGVGLVLVWRARGDGVAQPASGGARAVVVVVLVAVAFAIGIAVVRGPNADDAYYVNRSLYVQQHSGAFPTKDTLYADQRFPSTQPVDNLSGYEAFVGTLGAFLPFDVRTLIFLFFAPLFGAFGVFALWRLARSGGASWPLLATVAGVVFVVLQTPVRGWTDFAVRRAGQGKSVLMFFLVAWLWHHASAFARSGSRRSLAWSAVGGIAGIGLSSSGAFIAPFVIAAASLAIAGDRTLDLAAKVRRVALAASAVAYPVMVALVGASVAASQVHQAIPRNGVFQNWTQSMGTGRVVLVSTLIALAGWVLIRDRTISLGAGIVTLAVLASFTPPAQRVLHAIGLGSIGWRMAWAIPLPAVAGLAIDAPIRMFGSIRGGALALAGTVMLAGVLGAQPRPVLGPSQDVTVGKPSWDVDPALLAAASRLVRLAARGGVVAATREVGPLVPQVTTTVFATDVRVPYTNALDRALGPRFNGQLRLDLTDFLDGQDVPGRTTRRSLRALRVDAACSAPGATSEVTAVLRGAGFHRAGHDDVCAYWSR